MKNKRVIWGIAVMVAMVAVAVFINPENRGMVTGLFQSRNSFAGRSKNDWLTDLASSKFSVKSKAHLALIYQEGAESGVPILIDGLKHDSGQVRAECADILGSYGGHGKAAIQPLMAALDDLDPEVKIKASDSLQKLVPDSKVAIPALARLLVDTDKDVRLHAAGCLGGFGADARPAWEALVRLHKEEKDPYILGQVAQAMYLIDNVAAWRAGVEQPRIL
jgi:HEAT repeat protein